MARNSVLTNLVLDHSFTHSCNSPGRVELTMEKEVSQANLIASDS